MQDINKAMGQTVSGMANAMKSMDPEKIAKTMEQFEKQFEDMDVRSQYMEQVRASVLVHILRLYIVPHSFIFIT